MSPPPHPPACRDERGDEPSFALRMNRPISLPCWNAESCLPFGPCESLSLRFVVAEIIPEEKKLGVLVVSLPLLFTNSLTLILHVVQRPALCMDPCSHTLSGPLIMEAAVCVQSKDFHLF